MLNFNLKYKTNISGKMSLYSVLSIITVIIICTAVWKMFDLAKTTYMYTLKGTSKEMPKEKTAVKQDHGQNLFLRKLFVAFHLAAAALENTNDQARLKENELKATSLLKKYAKAQEIYKKHYGYYAEKASELIIEESGKYTIIDPTLKALNASYRKENPTDGYYFVELAKKGSEGHISSFFLSAVPAQYGISGINTICIFSLDEQTKILKNNNGGKPVFDISSLDSSWGNL